MAEEQHGTDVLKWADEAMFRAAPMQSDPLGRIRPRVTLLSATPDPLGVNAAGFRMYAGHPTYDLDDLTDDDRMRWWEESHNTFLAAPWEFIHFVFHIEAVTRAFTHQMVRQRTAAYAQESLRFAVKENMAKEIPFPPSVIDEGELAMNIWTQAIQTMERHYNMLINAGIPAEDARGLLPHATTTRIIYATNFRNLVDTMGKRLCTQAQFEWRAVALGIMKAIRDHDPRTGVHYDSSFKSGDAWQFEEMAKPRPKTFTPVCYQAGKCVYMGELDRKCTIRERVNEFADEGISSKLWHQDHINHLGATIPGIDPSEWMADHTAARRDVADRP